MNAIVCINNNVVRDSRVKRQVNALADEYEHVHVVAVAEPDENFGVQRNNVTYSFAKIEHYDYPATPYLREQLKKWKLYDEIVEYCPILESDTYNQYFEMRYLAFLYKILTSSERYQEIQNRKAEKMDLQPALSYIIRFIENSIGIAKEAEKYEADVIICNDEDSLLAGVVHKRNKGTKLIYDIHDLMCDITQNVFPLVYSEMLVLYEKNMVQYADCVMGAGKYLLEWIDEHYCLKVPCVPIFNCGTGDKILLQEKKYDEENIRIYYQGLAYPNRNLEILIRAIQDIDEVSVVIRSDDNEYVKTLKKLVDELELTGRVSFVDLVSTEKVYEAANKDGDIGIYLADPSESINWRASFTNKFLEYLTAGLPVITTNARDQAEIVLKYDCGYVLENLSIEELRNLLIQIKKDRKELAEKSKNAMYVGQQLFDWNIYKEQMLNLIKEKPINNSKVETTEKCIWTNEEKKIQRKINKIQSYPKIMKYLYAIKEEKYETVRDNRKLK